MKENRLLWIVNIICSIVLVRCFFSPRNSRRVSLSLLTLLQEANLYELLYIPFPVWDGIGLILQLSLILQRILCFVPVRMKILIYSLKKSIVRGHVLKMNYLHDSDIGFLSLVCFCPRMIKWSTFPWWSSILFFDRIF